MKVQWDQYSIGFSILEDIYKLCQEFFPHIEIDHNFGTKFLEGWVHVTPHILALGDYNFDFLIIVIHCLVTIQTQ